MYLKQSGCIGQLFALVGVLAIAASGIILIVYLIGPKDQVLAVLGMVLFAAGCVIVLLVRKTARRQWFRKL